MAKKQEYRVALVLSWAVYMYFLCIHSNKRREKKVDGVQSPKERRRDTICDALGSGRKRAKERRREDRSRPQGSTVDRRATWGHRPPP